MLRSVVDRHRRFSATFRSHL